MYLEDADICRRINNSGNNVIYSSMHEVIHHAQRQSFKNTKHIFWHLKSLLRFILQYK